MHLLITWIYQNEGFAGPNGVKGGTAWPEIVFMNSWSPMVGGLNRLSPKELRSRQWLISEESRQTGLVNNQLCPSIRLSRLWTPGQDTYSLYKKGLTINKSDGNLRIKVLKCEVWRWTNKASIVSFQVTKKQILLACSIQMLTDEDPPPPPTPPPPPPPREAWLG